MKNTIEEFVRNGAGGKAVGARDASRLHGRTNATRKTLALGVGMLIAGGMNYSALAGEPTLFVNDGTDGGCGSFNESVGTQVHVSACSVQSMADLKSADVAAGTMVINGYGTFINGKLSMLAGTAADNAVNVGQLSPLINALGGNSKIDASTGQVTGPTYALTNGGTQATVAGALTGLDGAITTANTNLTTLKAQLGNGEIGLVRQDGTGQAITLAASLDGDTVDFTGKKEGVSLSRKLTGVSDGTLSSTSTDAVTGAQLFATNKDVKVNASNITALTEQVNSGSVGLVKQDVTTHAITVAGATGGTSISVAGTDGVRVLSGVANGTADHDAVTVAQLKAAGLVNPNGKPALAMVYDDLAMSGATLGGTQGTVLHHLASGTIGKDSMDAINGGQLFDFQQDMQNRMNALGGKFDTLNDQVSHIQQGLDDGSMGGSGGKGSGEGSAVMGDGAQASGSGSMAMGTHADASGDNSMASGANAVASGAGSIANGSGAQATGDNSMASGANAVASGTGSIANGSGAQATGDDSMASGANAAASGKGSTAVGANSSATGNNAVALGAGSVADRDNVVSVGSVGNERQIANVAAGTLRTDAANWGQVQDAVQGVRDWANRRIERVDDRIDRMGAMSAAYSQMAFSATGIDTPNRFGVGVGMQGGKSAVALGVSHRFSPHVNVSFGGSASGPDASMGAGMAIGW